MNAERKTKTNHQSGWHKKIVNPTTNFPKDEHKQFCRRCLAHNFVCPVTGDKPTNHCEL